MKFALQQFALFLIPLFGVAIDTSIANDTEKTVLPVTDGMTIETSDSIGNIEVRAKSFGPGACGVKFEIADQKTEFLAPPLMWSPWTVVASHTASVAWGLAFESICDTGAVAEVRYYSK